MYISLPIFPITSLTTPTTSPLAHSSPTHVQTKTHCAWLFSGKSFKGCMGNIDQLHCPSRMSWRPPGLQPLRIWTRWWANWICLLCLGWDTWRRPICWRRRIMVQGILKWSLELVVHMPSVLHLSTHIKWCCWRDHVEYNKRVSEVSWACVLCQTQKCWHCVQALVHGELQVRVRQFARQRGTMPTSVISS